MEFPVMNQGGTQVSTVDLPDGIFGLEEVNIGLMHQAYVRQMANARQGTASAKSRSEIRLTGAKVWRQKGTGRARHGARSAPIFVGGGLAHPPRPRDYTKKMPKKMRRKAIRCALTTLVRDEQLIVVDKLEMDAPKTKVMRDILKAVAGGESVLVLFTEGEEVIRNSVHNLSSAHALRANYLNIRDLFKYDKVIMPLSALEVIAGIWGDGVAAGEKN
ncbi:MAG: 50S ribosomal protein L4 [Aggregatilineales bacterium]